MLIDLTITGTTPLLLNAFTDEAAMAATSGTRSAISAGDKGSPKEQAEKKLYVGSDGQTLIIPNPNMFRCIIDGGSYHKNGKSKITTLKSSLIPSCLAIQETEIPIVYNDDWRVDTRAVRIPSTGGRILCHRPCFDDWELSFTLELDEEFMSPKLVRAIIDDSGKRVGLGDFRPACKGPFGKFVVVNWFEQKQSS